MEQAAYTPDEEAPDGRRLRRLTERAEENYQTKLCVFQNKLINYRKSIEQEIINFRTSERLSKQEILDIQNRIDKDYEEYQNIMKEYIQYLTDTHTTHSMEEMKKQNIIHRMTSTDVVKVLNDIQKVLKNVTESTSSIRGSHSSKHSRSSSVIAEQKARLKAAQTRLEYEKHEALLREEKSKLDNKISMLDKEKEVAVETAVLETLEEELDESENRSVFSSISQKPRLETTPIPNPEPLTLNPGAVPFIPETQSNHMYSNNNQPIKTEVDLSQQYSALSSYLMKRDLIVERLHKFDDTPESYNAWMVSFRTVMRDLRVTAEEEFDLLMKYLGPSSKQHAQTIRQANSNDLARGVEQVWERLGERFGSPELIEASLKRRIQNFPNINNNNQSELYKLSDLCSEIESMKGDSKYQQLLGYFDSSTGVKPIAEKLPPHLRNKWVSRASAYKREKCVYFPPFSEFCKFLREVSVMCNDPSLSVSNQSHNRNNSEQCPRVKVRVNKTVTDEFKTNSCPLHNGTSSHSLNSCKTFKAKSVSDRKRYLKDKNICFKCCNSTSHVYKTCSFTGRCDECGSERHPSALHHFQQSSTMVKNTERPAAPDVKNHGRESHPDVLQTQSVTNNCTSVCGDSSFSGKSCSKTLLVKLHPVDQPEKAVMAYCIIDDQSNRTLCKSELFQMFDTVTNNMSVGVENYDLVSCSGKSLCSGRTLSGLAVTSLDDSFSLALPTVLECDKIPDSRSEIPTPDITRYYKHLNGIPIAPLQTTVDIVLLIGRDAPEALHVHEQRIAVGQPNAPFAQRLGLGWVIVGEVCLNSHKPRVNVLKTYVHSDGRPSLFEPCESKITVKPREPDVFVQTNRDEEIGLSIEDQEFIEIMEKEFCKDETGHWSAPLPFKSPRPLLANNRKEAYRRAMSLHASLRKDNVKREHFLDFMGNIFTKGYAEIAPTLQDEECWYLPLFGVYHPKKEKLRVVFDSSSKFEGVSLNDVLLTGPDLTNNLTGILMRFRREKIAITGDIEQMFYQFRVHERDRNFLRFLWYRDNDISKELIEYRMCVHVFGNSPSPAVATYGLRKTAQVSTERYDGKVCSFVDNDFYVDDGLTSVPSVQEAVELITNTQHALREGGNLRFHKITSNSVEVLKSLPEEDLAKDLKQCQIGVEDLPVQRSLGLGWDLNKDCFIFQLSQDKILKRTYTKRNVLSIINSLFDPLGFLSPVTIIGKLLLRDITSEVKDWDEPLPEHLHKEWEKWVQSLKDIESINIPREIGFDPVESSLIVCCDASEKAISSVAFLKTVTQDETVQFHYVFGKSKVAPKHGHTIPRLELCAAVLSVEIAETVSRELSIHPGRIVYYSDSRIVLGYLSNKTRRFYVYVQNRVSRILKFSNSDQWKYIETDLNPADVGTRGIGSHDMQDSTWLNGQTLRVISDSGEKDYQLVSPEGDLEVRPLVTNVRTEVGFGNERFKKFSSWTNLVIAISLLTQFVKCFKNQTSSSKMSYKTEEAKTHAQELIIKQVQLEAYGSDIACLKVNKTLPKDSSIITLAPFLENSLLRVGGRLARSSLPPGVKHPVLIPGGSHIALLLVRHFHEQVHHQGRRITEGAVRDAGFWITGGKRLVSKVIHRCVICRKLRGKFSEQKMADLPPDRTTPAPPFTFVGVDLFGPWSVVTRRTRGGVASSKRWAVMFACLTTRAVHIEIVEEMSSAAFINALRRFVAIRGPVKVFRSDRGTNFIGAADSIGVDVINVEDKSVKDFLYNGGSTWIFNPPHASHMSGSWERMIGVTRRVLDAILLQHKNKSLTHDVLLTFMAEVSAIVNARPIVPVSSDCSDPAILSPSVLLTQKTGNNSIEICPQLDIKDMYKSQWKTVQVLAEQFWKKWRSEYLSELQKRPKWTTCQSNIQVGNVVLMKDSDVNRNCWPVAIVTDTFPSSDSMVRTVRIKVIRDGKPIFYTRPVSELVLLISD